MGRVAGHLPCRWKQKAHHELEHREGKQKKYSQTGKRSSPSQPEWCGGSGRDRTNRRARHFEQEHEMPSETECFQAERGCHPETGLAMVEGGRSLLQWAENSFNMVRSYIRNKKQINKQREKGKGTEAVPPTMDHWWISVDCQ